MTRTVVNVQSVKSINLGQNSILIQKVIGSLDVEVTVIRVVPNVYEEIHLGVTLMLRLSGLIGNSNNKMARVLFVV